MTTQLKRRFSLAVLVAAAGLIAGAVQTQSSVTSYGQVGAQVGATKNLDQGRTWGISSDGMSTSYWGPKGNEDLGSGLKAIFTLEVFSHPDIGKSGRSDGDHSFARNSFVGLQPNIWGSIKLSRNISLYLVSTILFNPLVDLYTFSPMVLHTYLSNSNSGVVGISGLVGDSGQNNSIMYSTPDMGGLASTLIHGTGEQAGHNGQNKWGGSLLYLRDNFAAAVAFQQVHYDSAPGNLSSLVVGFSCQAAGQLGATYDSGVVKLYGQYQCIKNTISADDAENNGDQLGVLIPAGPGSILASCAYTKTSGAADAKRNTWTTGYDYSLSECTDVHAACFRNKVSDLLTTGAFGVGTHAKL